jgi:esterase
MKVHYRIIGEGQPLIILHGLFGSADNWQTLAKGFAEKFKVVLVDQRNHGHAPHTDEMNYDVMADDLLELFQKENLKNAILMGHSMGGKTAMWFAQKHTELLDKLIVVDMGLKKYPPHHQIIFDALLSLDLNNIKSRKEAEEHLRKTITDIGVLQFLLKNLYWSDKEKLDWRFNLQVLYREIDGILEAVPAGRVDVNTLFIRGEKSNYILDSDFEKIKEHFPNSKIETVAGAGHWVHAEKPREFFERISEFIN